MQTNYIKDWTFNKNSWIYTKKSICIRTFNMVLFSSAFIYKLVSNPTYYQNQRSIFFKKKIVILEHICLYSWYRNRKKLIQNIETYKTLYQPIWVTINDSIKNKRERDGLISPNMNLLSTLSFCERRKGIRIKE